MARDYTKEIEKRYAEEVRERKAKAGIQADASTTALKLFKHYVKRKPLVKEVTCKKCGKVFKTNRNTILCFDCEKKGNKYFSVDCDHNKFKDLGVINYTWKWDNGKF